MGLVEGHVQPQKVGRQVSPQAVGGCPAEVEPGIGAAEVEAAAEQADDQEQHRREGQLGERTAGLGSVDEDADDLRIEQPQPDIGQDQRGEPGDAPALRRKVLAEQLPLRTQRGAPGV